MFLIISALNFKQPIFFIVLFHFLHLFMHLSFGGLAVGNATALNSWLSCHDLLRSQNASTHLQELVLTENIFVNTKLFFCSRVLFLLMFLFLLLPFLFLIYVDNSHLSWPNTCSSLHSLDQTVTYPIIGLVVKWKNSKCMSMI